MGVYVCVWGGGGGYKDLYKTCLIYYEVLTETLYLIGENYSSAKIIRRRKLFVGENYLSGKINCRGKLFVGEYFPRQAKISQLFHDE